MATARARGPPRPRATGGSAPAGVARPARRRTRTARAGGPVTPGGNPARRSRGPAPSAPTRPSVRRTWSATPIRLSMAGADVARATASSSAFPAKEVGVCCRGGTPAEPAATGCSNVPGRRPSSHASATAPAATIPPSSAPRPTSRRNASVARAATSTTSSATDVATTTAMTLIAVVMSGGRVTITRMPSPGGSSLPRRIREFRLLPSLAGDVHSWRPGRTTRETAAGPVIDQRNGGGRIK
jgi:hypothetical protein